MVKRPSAYTHCFRPIHIHGNVVPCGQCPSCLRMKSSRQTDSIVGYSLDNIEDKIIFLTLTYSNANLPLSLVSFDNSDTHDVVPFTSERYGEVYRGKSYDFYSVSNAFNFAVRRSSFSLRLSDTEWLLPTLSRYDIQLFLKRLRKQYSHYVENKKLPFHPIRHYSVGEYGPQHFRPHYHILLFCKNDIYTWLKRNLDSLWTYGYHYPKRADIGTSKYLAQYVNSTASLPNYLKTPFTRPFAIHSNFFYKSLCEYEKETIRECRFANLDGYFYINNGKASTCLYSLSYISRLFPKPYSYDPRNRQEGLRTLQTYVWFRDYYKEVKVSELAKRFTSSEDRYKFSLSHSWQLSSHVFPNMDIDRLLRILYTSKFFYNNALKFFPELDEYSAMQEYYKVITKYYDYIAQKSLSNFYVDQCTLMDRNDLTNEDKALRLGNMYIDSFPRDFRIKSRVEDKGYFKIESLIDPIFGDEIPCSQFQRYVLPRITYVDKHVRCIRTCVYDFWKTLGIDILDYDIPYDVRHTSEIVSYRNEVTRMLNEDVKHKVRNDYNRKWLSEAPIQNIYITT